MRCALSDALVAHRCRAGYYLALLALSTACKTETGLGPPTSKRSVASVTVAPDSATMQVGGSVQLSASARDSVGAVIAGRSVSWSTSSESVAAVSADGLVTAISPGGPISIVAAVESHSDTVLITVRSPATASIGPNGGAISTLSGNHVDFSPGAVTGSVKATVRDTIPVDPRYPALSPRAVAFVLPITGTQFGDSGTIDILMPLASDARSGALAYVRARILGFDEPLWALGSVFGKSILRVSLKAKAMAEAKRVLGLDTLSMVLDAEEIMPAPELAASTRSLGTILRSRSAHTPPAACERLPSGASVDSYAPCHGSLLRILDGIGSGANKRIGVVLVHGWLGDVVTEDDYFTQQGMVCRLPVADGPCAAWNVPLTPPSTRALPGVAYFDALIFALKRSRAVSGTGLPVYVFDYQSNYHYNTSGGQLAAALRVARQRDALDGFVFVAHSMGGLVVRSAAQLFERNLDAQTMLGVITLDTPHLGSYYSRCIGESLCPQAYTPGYRSLSLDQFLPRLDRIPTILYGGDINPLPGFDHEPIYRQGWTGLCAYPASSSCSNDGVVTISSQIPAQFPGQATPARTFADYDHSQMKYSRGAQRDPLNLYENIAADVSLLALRAGVTSLSFSTNIGGGVVGTSLPAIRAVVKDALGLPMINRSIQTSLTIGSGPTGAALSGVTASVTDNTGVATFSGLAVDRAGSYVLKVTAVGLSENSNSFTISGSQTPATSASIFALSSSFGCVIDAAQVAACSGHNSTAPASYQSEFGDFLGDGLRTNRESFAPVSGAHRFSALSGGPFQTCGLSAGLAWCWGYNVSGMFGNGTKSSSITPVRGAFGLSLLALSLGQTHACGIGASRDAYCWGTLTLSDFTSLERLSPTAVAGNLKWLTISAGASHTCGVTVDNVAYCWGPNYAGQLGPSAPNGSDVPIVADVSLRYVDIGAANNASCGLAVSGAVRCWGRFGGNTTSTINADGPFVRITVGAYHACALDASGEAWCWGLNGNGQVGIAAPSVTNVGSPRQIAAVPGVGVLHFESIYAGFTSTCGRTMRGDTYCWGMNSNGTLGDGSLVDRYAPVLVTVP